MLESPLLIPCLLGCLVLLQLVVLMLLLRLSGRVSRLCQSSAPPSPAANRDLASRKEANGEQKKWFTEFLAEDPSRKELPKKEQFAAFRRWREERGLNWKAPAGSE
jgi:hypothetical protein